MSEANLGLVEELNGKYIFTSPEMKIEVGDTKQTLFYPQTKLIKWDNEVNFSLRYTSDTSGSTYSKDAQNIITWTDKYGVKVRMFETTDPNDNTASGFEFEFELPIKPATNIFDMTIQTKELDFFYQNPTDKQAQDWIDRATEASTIFPEAKIYIPASLEEAKRGICPENVVGSYAVYHKSKNNNQYKTGKAFHIYRPKATDKEGNWTWCELKVDTNTETLTVTVPQDFLDNAIYPVIVDPTLGFTTAGSSVVQFFNNGTTSWQCGFYTVTATENGTVDSIQVLASTAGVGKMSIASGASLPASFITNGTCPEFTYTGTSAWQVVNYVSKPTITNGTKYYLTVIPNTFGNNHYYDDTTPASDGDVASYSSPAELKDGPFSFNGKLSIYINYTASGGGAVTPSIRRQIILEGVGRGIFDGVK